MYPYILVVTDRISTKYGRIGHWLSGDNEQQIWAVKQFTLEFYNLQELGAN